MAPAPGAIVGMHCPPELRLPRSILAAAFGVAASVLVSCGGHVSGAASAHAPAHGTLPTPSDLVPAAAAASFRVPPPPLTEGVFPCTDCHDPEIAPRTERRELKWAHQEIELRHDEDNRWCLDCHDADDRDLLHLANGELVPFEQSDRLCGQCHGDKHRDWRAGVHGRRTGSWSGEKTYQLCVHCHDAHTPAFQPLAPLPPPPRPVRTP